MGFHGRYGFLDNMVIGSEYPRALFQVLPSTTTFPLNQERWNARKLKSNLRAQRGQGITEYGLILGLITAAIIVAVSVSH
jgi:hypothetical protein